DIARKRMISIGPWGRRLRIAAFGAVSTLAAIQPARSRAVLNNRQYRLLRYKRSRAGDRASALRTGGQESGGPGGLAFKARRQYYRAESPSIIELLKDCKRRFRGNHFDLHAQILRGLSSTTQ